MTRILSERELLKQAASVHDVLAIYGLRAWTSQEIDAYKQAALDKAPPQSMLWERRRWLAKAFTNVQLSLMLTLAIAVSGAGVGICVLAGEALLDSIWPMPLKLTFLVTVAFAVYFSAALFVLFAIERLADMKLRGPAAWSVQTIEEYLNSARSALALRSTEAIPPEVMPLHAREILRLAPDAKARVHSLWQEEFLLDPILEIDGVFALVWDGDGTIVRPPA